MDFLILGFFDFGPEILVFSCFGGCLGHQPGPAGVLAPPALKAKRMLKAGWGGVWADPFTPVRDNVDPSRLARTGVWAWSTSRARHERMPGAGRAKVPGWRRAGRHAGHPAKRPVRAQPKPPKTAKKTCFFRLDIDFLEI